MAEIGFLLDMDGPCHRATDSLWTFDRRRMRVMAITEDGDYYRIDHSPTMRFRADD